MSAGLAVIGLVLVAAWLPRHAARPVVAPPPPAARRVRPRRHRRLVDDALADAIDVLVLALQSGALPAQALGDLARFGPPAVRPAAERSLQHIADGGRFGDAILVLPASTSTAYGPMCDLLAAADRDGLPLAPVLERLADDARAARRRRAEGRARELPVRLAAPLVLCTLPSFVLLAVVPLLVGALSSLPL